jgi:hypothetical protein
LWRITPVRLDDADECLVLVAAEVLFELLEVVQDNRGFAPQGADHLRSGMPGRSCVPEALRTSAG